MDKTRVIRCYPYNQVISRTGVDHKAREIILTNRGAMAKTLCKKFITIPQIGKSPAVKKACETCYGD